MLGMQAKLPLRDPLPSILKWVNDSEKIAVKASVDLPTGITENGIEHPLRADFTYCTGIVKELVTDSENADFVGRLRYLDLNFFTNDRIENQSKRVLQSNALSTLRKLRCVEGDKRSARTFIPAGRFP